MDSDTDAVRKVAEVLAQARIGVTVGEVHVGIQGITEATFNRDDRLGRWSGPIPTDKLLDDDDTPWTLEFDRITSLEMVIEKKPAVQ